MVVETVAISLVSMLVSILNRAPGSDDKRHGKDGEPEAEKREDEDGLECFIIS